MLKKDMFSTTKQRDELVKNKFIEMEKYLNAVETELNKKEPTTSVISYNFGKISSNYKDLVLFLGIYQ